MHVISTVARGGFSGAPVIDEYGFLLGIFTESLSLSEKDSELGFAGVLSIDPLLRLLKKKRIRFVDNLNVLADQDHEDRYSDWWDAKARELHGENSVFD